MAKRRRNSDWDIGGVILIIGMVIAAKTESLLLGAAFVIIATFGPGMLIRRARQRRARASGITESDTMDGVSFEPMLADRFKSAGWRVELTPKYGDFGADLILTSAEEKVVVQAKRHTNTVGISAVQQVIGALHHYKADRAMVVSNSFFTPAAEKLASTSGVELLDRQALEQFLLETGRRVKQDGARATAVCPRCGRPLVVRNGKRGEFWGCSGFPGCRYTRDLE